MSPPENAPLRVVGRYALFGEIASGGMATVHFGRLLGPVGFARTVAIKRLHPQFAKDPEFVSMFLDEARLAARIRHPNVVPTLDVVATAGELFLVMEYVQGESLSRLLRAVKRRNERVPIPILVAIMAGVLHGLHAAHEAKNEQGEPLGIVHRDVSPHNVLVGTDGVARVLDFGVAKAAGRVQTTKEGQIKGKLAYMPPEQLNGMVSRKTDVYAASVVLWEALAGERLFTGDNEGELLTKILLGKVVPPSAILGNRFPDIASELPKALDDATLRGIDRDPEKRFATAREMAIALQKAVPLAAPSDIGEWVESLAHDTLMERSGRIAEIENSSSSDVRVPMRMSEPPSPTLVARLSPPTPPPRIDATEPSSQLSSITMSKSDSLPSEARKKRRGVVAAMLAFAVLASIALVIVLTRRGADRTTASGARGGEPPPKATATTTPPKTTGASEPGSASPSPSPSPSAGASIATASSTTASIAGALTTTKPPPPATTHAPISKPKPKADCSTPYTVDEKGKKHFKPECL